VTQLGVDKSHWDELPAWLSFLNQIISTGTNERSVYIKIFVIRLDIDVNILQTAWNWGFEHAMFVQ